MPQQPKQPQQNRETITEKQVADADYERDMLFGRSGIERKEDEARRDREQRRKK